MAHRNPKFVSNTRNMSKFNGCAASAVTVSTAAAILMRNFMDVLPILNFASERGGIEKEQVLHRYAETINQIAKTASVADVDVVVDFFHRREMGKVYGGRVCMHTIQVYIFKLARNR
ncbi:hypothetical protein Trydic_g21185 [Trypoxylus dichotomus]